MVFGGTYPAVSGQPPHRAIQNCLPASTTARRASSTARLAPHLTTTFDGNTSRIWPRSSFPVLHFCQYGRFDTGATPTTPRSMGRIDRDNRVACKANVTRLSRVNHPSCGRPIRTKAAQSDRPRSLLLSVSGSTASQAGCNLFRLPEGFGVAPPSRLRKPIKSPVRHLPGKEIHGDDLGHVLVSSVAALVERHPVSAT